MNRERFGDEIVPKSVHHAQVVLHVIIFADPAYNHSSLFHRRVDLSATHVRLQVPD
jgi:hypothetical protein